MKVDNYLIIREAKQVNLTIPKNIESKDYIFFEPYSPQKLPEVRLYRLKNISITVDGFIFKKLSLLEDSFVLTSEGFIKTHNWKGLLKLILTWKRRQLPKDKVYLVVHNLFTAYFHWVAESIPKLLLIKDQLQDLVLLLPETYNAPFYNESLDLLGIKNVYRLKEKTYYKVTELVFPSAIAAQQNFDPQLLQLVKKFMLEKTASFKAPIQNPKIYISRAKAAKRKIINEKEVMEFLREKGFMCLELEDFSFYEQIKISNQAKVMVSIHGAGLTNIMFMEKGTKVLELRKHDNGEMHYYYSLASAMEVGYYYQFCESDQPDLPVMHANIYVDIEKLAQNVDLILREA